MDKSVGLKLAKLLKEKGFDNYTPLKYFSKKPSGYNIINWSENTPYNCEDIYSQLSLGYNNQTYFTWAPTIAEVVMWLHEKHGIWIYSRPFSDNGFRSFIVDKTGDMKEAVNTIKFNKPTEAYSAAIEYTLEKLIFQAINNH